VVLFDQFDGLSCEFLENVDFGAVGVEEGVGIVSTRDLAQIATVRTTFPPDIPVDVPGSLRGREEQGFDAIAGSTIKVISGVVDSSFNATYSARFYHLPHLSICSDFSFASRFTSAATGDQSRVVKHGAVEVREWVLDCGFGAGDEGEGGGWGGAEEEEHVHKARILRSFESMMGGNSGKARKNKLASLSLTGSTGTGATVASIEAVRNGCTRSSSCIKVVGALSIIYNLQLYHAADGIALHLTFLTAPPLAPQLSTEGRLPHLHFEFDAAIKC